ncbi:endo-1,4-beta-xylanase [Mucilaginibacter sp. PPCGB 2223]|uniref:alpha/beta hydrolase n=1 Tax=Mucilaginibacter sp. PPCGB 2223 TaxID=1886027 RepID=UPI000825A92F|nr:alpha/beta hydrolase [Mucilaginibacter sp. PPCGB 2223]OCX52998.1 endo-1,4-beta-xylanase [Mucilaginibacter sp. PPCGB 2223]
MQKVCRLLIILFWLPAIASAQEIIKLYPGAIPNSRQGKLPDIAAPYSGMINRVTIPEMEIYLPQKGNETGAAVIVCPGGSYKVLTYEAEGVRTAKELAKNGIAAFVLKYRLPDDSTMIDKKIGPLQDAQQAIRLVRENAGKWSIDTSKVGIMGFSAGGHLAATLATHYQQSYIDNSDHINLRPAFVILVYPVISMQDGLTHKDSRTNLLGKTPSKQTIDLFSNELQADKNTPPAYITHAGDDKLVDVDNSIAFYEKLRHNNVPAELHLFPKGGHGFVLRENPATWMKPLFTWMKNQKLITEQIHN